jgi:hypothetical protein
MRDFLPQNLPLIVANTLLKAIYSKKLQLSLEQLCQVNQQTLSQVISENFIKIYSEIYIQEDSRETVRLCKEYFAKSMEKTIREQLKVTRRKRWKKR